MTSLPATTRSEPVGALLAPAVRLMKLAPALSTQAEAGVHLALTAGDIARVEITLLSSGVSQYSVTLCNWSTATQADRAQVARNGLPWHASAEAWPRFRYNAFDIVNFGDRLRLDMRYYPDPPAGLPVATREAHVWTPMISGPVTDMRFSFGNAAEVTITGEDDLSPLKDRHDKREDFSSPERAEMDIVRAVLALAKYPLTQPASPRVQLPSFVQGGGKGLAEALQEGQSYYEYLEKLAQKMDFEVFVAFDSLDAAEQRGVKLHFEPSRARAGPKHPDCEVFVLQRDRNLIAFAPTIKLLDQPSEVKVNGRHRDRGRAELVSEISTAAQQLLNDELYADDGDSNALIAGPAVREKYFKNRRNPLTMPNQSNIDQDRARCLADATLRARARQFMTIEATTLGLPRARPGNYILIRDMRPPFDGYYYITKAVHSLGPDGYKTTISARRPGMPLPPYQERRR